MKHCEKCNKIIDEKYGSGRFCGRSCSNSRLHTQESKLKIKDALNIYFKNRKQIKKCISCEEVIKNNVKYCKTCLSFYNNISMFNKLNIYEKNLKIASKLALEKLKYLYFEQKMSTLQIYEIYNIRINSIYWFFKKNNISLRNAKQSINNAILNDRLKLHNGKKTIQYKHGWHTTWFNTEVFLRSSYEFKFVEYLDYKKIYYEVESKKIPYNIGDESHIYIPDFYIPNLNLLIETKNKFYYNKNKNIILEQQSICKKLGYNILLLVDDEIDEYINNDKLNEQDGMAEW